MSDQKQLGLFDKKEEYNDNYLTFDKIRRSVSTLFDTMYSTCGTYSRNTDNKIIDIMAQKYFENHREHIDLEILNNNVSFKPEEIKLQCQGCRSNITIGVIYKTKTDPFMRIFSSSDEHGMSYASNIDVNHMKYYCYKCGHLYYMAITDQYSVETILYVITESLPY